jgi:hypothetical protein
MSDIQTQVEIADGGLVVTTRETMRNALGQDVPVELVKPVDKLRDEVVRELCREYEEAESILSALKEKVRNDLEAFLEISSSRSGEDLGGKKGNVTVYSYDGALKIVRNVRAQMVFDEGLEAAKRLIDECLNDWAGEGQKETRLIIDRILRPNALGRVNTASVLSLRSLAINDDRWIRAMAAISDNLKAINSQESIRAYRRTADGGWEMIRADM